MVDATRLSLFWMFQFEEIELWKNFANGVENHSDDIILSYNDTKANLDERELNKPLTHQQLSSEKWNLDVIFTDNLPNLYRRSAFLTLFGEFEDAMNKLCKKIADTNSYKIKLNDVNGTGIQRAYLYLNKVGDCEVNSPSWQIIKDLQSIRNKISHANGYIDKETNKDFERIIKTNSFIEIDLYHLKLKKGFLNYTIDAFEKYLKALYQSNPNIQS
ncbi:Uncharacterised protein [Legionella sainthelensi]|uniref:hypothetical protein n=1 Tax=Legionella sainthelensi TaxID=28087 RepID=UPI000F6DF447|nr:hypothetical protein [Legionella sainthelensi]VEB39076.1 Uncharacterised protein [Legionella sainthelensi]